MVREQNVALRTGRDGTANPVSPQPENRAKSRTWPDGGVVTQRTANPLPRRLTPQFFAIFTVRSPHGIPEAYGADCELSAPSVREAGR